MTSAYDTAALADYEYKGTSIYEVLIAGVSLSPYVVRFVVQGISAPPDTFYSSVDVTGLTELAKAVSVDFDKYSVLGVTVAPMSEPGSCIVDVVFDLLEWNMVDVSKDKMAAMGVELLGKRGLGLLNVTVDKYATLSSNPTLAAKWKVLPPIMQRVSSAEILIPTLQWKNSVMVGKSSPSFLLGVSTDPDSSSQIVITKAGSPPIPYVPKADAAAAGSSMNIPGIPVSVDKLAVAALMGYLGFRLVKAWRKF